METPPSPFYEVPIYFFPPVNEIISQKKNNLTKEGFPNHVWALLIYMGALVSAPQQQWWCWCMWQRGCGWTGDRVVGVHCAHHLRDRASKSGLLLLRETSIHQIGRMFALTSKGGIKTESRHLRCKFSYLFGIKNAKEFGISSTKLKLTFALDAKFIWYGGWRGWKMGLL